MLNTPSDIETSQVMLSQLLFLSSHWIAVEGENRRESAIHSTLSS